MKNARIIKRITVDKRVEYVIQNHSLFAGWYDVWYDDSVMRYRASFNSIDAAQEKLCHFDGTKVKEEVVG